MFSTVSTPMAVVILASTVGAFLPAPPGCVIAPCKTNRHCRANTACIMQRSRKPLPLLFAVEETQDSSENPAAVEDSPAVPADAASALVADVEEVAESPMTEQELARLEKLKEIERLRAKEKFITISTGIYVCDQCGYLYNPDEVVRGALPGTAFDDLPSTWLCPVCSAPKDTFVPQTKTIAGFEDNLQYGFGANTLTGGQKNLLIFGGLAAFFILFLLGYALE